jgi:magnesium chelatase family protein
MLATANSFILEGIAVRPIRVEVDVHRGLPGFAILGLRETAVAQVRERVRAALISSGFEFPLMQVVVNIAPASVRTAPGPGIDLAIAAALLAASGQLDSQALARIALVGELALDGSLRSVNGVFPFAEAARDAGRRAIAVPAQNGAEAALATGIDVVALDSLTQLAPLISGEWTPARPAPLPLLAEPHPDVPDLTDLRGQRDLHRALEISAAGGHSLLLVGSLGSGKSLAAARMPSILPPLTREEAHEVTAIASACGRLGNAGAARPFRVPHCTISAAGLIGGGSPSRPGEVTLAHRGVLFLDELCEFHRDSLAALREPLLSGMVMSVRSGARRSLPSRFLLIAAASPCPCGRGEGDPDCACALLARRRYRRLLSTTLAGQIDMQIAVTPPTRTELRGAPGESSAAIRGRVIAARAAQGRRLGAGRCNAVMSYAETRILPLDKSARGLLDKAAADRRFHSRDYRRAIGLAQTIADLAALDRIHGAEMTEALDLLRGP